MFSFFFYTCKNIPPLSLSSLSVIHSSYCLFMFPFIKFPFISFNSSLGCICYKLLTTTNSLFISIMMSMIPSCAKEHLMFLISTHLLKTLQLILHFEIPINCFFPFFHLFHIFLLQSPFWCRNSVGESLHISKTLYN